MAKRNFQRIVLKLSGEALAGDQGFGINPDVVEEFAPSPQSSGIPR